MSVRTLSQQKLSTGHYAKIKLPLPKGSVLFASGDYLTIANNSAFTFASPSGTTNDFTVEYWCYPTATSTMAPVGIAYSTGYWGFFLNYSNSGGVEFYQSDSAQMNSGASILSTNMWTHIAATRSGTVARLYVNGVEKATLTGSYAMQSTSSLYIGKEPILGRPFIGRLSNLRIVKGQALYTSNFTTPTSPLTAITGTTLLTCNSPTTITDSSTNALSISVGAGSPTASSSSPFA